MSALALGLRSAATRIDRVALAFALAVLALASVDAAQAWTGLVFTANSLLGVSPFLIGSVAVAAYTKASGADNLIARAFTGHMAAMVLVAALFGALSPFCSCGVIPLIAALLAMGVPLAAVMAFWLASPLMDPSMFVLTSGVLGLGFALSKTVAAIAIARPIHGPTPAAMPIAGSTKGNRMYMIRHRAPATAQRDRVADRPFEIDFPLQLGQRLLIVRNNEISDSSAEKLFFVRAAE